MGKLPCMVTKLIQLGACSTKLPAQRTTGSFQQPLGGAFGESSRSQVPVPILLFDSRVSLEVRATNVLTMAPWMGTVG